MIVTLRITVGRDGNGAYVLGNGSALGVDSDPLPNAARPAAGVVDEAAGEGAAVDVVGCGDGAAPGGPDVRRAQPSAVSVRQAPATSGREVEASRIARWILGR
jgi:hypothetical protein